MQSRYFEFGEDTIVRADQYDSLLSIELNFLVSDLRLQVHPTHIRPPGAIGMAVLPNAYDRDKLDGVCPGDLKAEPFLTLVCRSR